MGMLNTFWNWLKGKKKEEPSFDPLEYYKYYNPDTIWRAPGAITFFYDPNTDWLAKVDGHISHAEMLKMPEFGPKLLPDKWQQNISKPRSEVVQRGIFSGRLIPHQIVTLWNTDTALYTRSFKNFLNKLKKENLIDENTVVRTPVHEAFYAGTMLWKLTQKMTYDPAMLHTSVGGYSGKIRGYVPPKDSPTKGLWRGTSENAQ